MAHNSITNITHIAHDHISSILHLLPIDSILSFATTCKRFKFIASSDTLWKSICRRDWGDTSVDAILATLSSSQRNISWKKIYQQISQLGSVSCLRLGGKDSIFPRPRASHSLNFISDCLVLFGGGYEGGRHLDDTWVAYIGNEVRRVLRWQQINSGIPSGRFGQTCNVIGDVLVLFGGINDNGIRQNDTWVCHVTREESLEIKLSWGPLEVGPTAPPPRGAHAGCSVSNKWMVIHGGIGLDGLRLNDTWLLDLSDGISSAMWREIVSLPSPPARSGHSLTWIGGTIMVLFGGRGSAYEVLNDVWLLDMGGEYPVWVEMTFNTSNIHDRVVPYPRPRVGHSATLILGGRVLIYGGEDSQRRRKDDFWVLDIGAVPTVGMRCQTQNPRRPYGKMWKKLKAEGCQPRCRSFHRSCTDDSGRFVYIFGGMVDGVILPAESSGLKFNGELYVVELVLQS